jgi:hypothetical protein
MNRDKFESRASNPFIPYPVEEVYRNISEPEQSGACTCDRVPQEKLHDSSSIATSVAGQRIARRLSDSRLRSCGSVKANKVCEVSRLTQSPMPFHCGFQVLPVNCYGVEDEGALFRPHIPIYAEKEWSSRSPCRMVLEKIAARCWSRRSHFV